MLTPLHVPKGKKGEEVFYRKINKGLKARKAGIFHETASALDGVDFEWPA